MCHWVRVCPDLSEGPFRGGLSFGGSSEIGATTQDPRRPLGALLTALEIVRKEAWEQLKNSYSAGDLQITHGPGEETPSGKP